MINLTLIRFKKFTNRKRKVHYYMLQSNKWSTKHSNCKMLLEKLFVKPKSRQYTVRPPCHSRHLHATDLPDNDNHLWQLNLTQSFPKTYIYEDESLSQPTGSHIHQSLNWHLTPGVRQVWTTYAPTKTFEWNSPLENLGLTGPTQYTLSRLRFTTLSITIESVFYDSWWTFKPHLQKQLG